MRAVANYFYNGLDFFRPKTEAKQLEPYKILDQALQILAGVFKINGAYRHADLSSNSRRGVKFKMAVEAVTGGKAKLDKPQLSPSSIRTFTANSLTWLTAVNVPILATINACRAINSLYPLAQVAGNMGKTLTMTAEAVTVISEKWVDGVLGLGVYSVCRGASFAIAAETMGQIWTYRTEVGYIPLFLYGLDAVSTTVEFVRVPLKFTAVGAAADPFLAIIAGIIRIGLLLLYSRIDSPEVRLQAVLKRKWI